MVRDSYFSGRLSTPGIPATAAVEFSFEARAESRYIQSDCVLSAACFRMLFARRGQITGKIRRAC
jgi:hypothetical protein